MPGLGQGQSRRERSSEDLRAPQSAFVRFESKRHEDSMTERESLGSISPFFVVRDVPRAVRFYEEQLGFEVRDRDGYVLFFGRPG
jgi:catechol-2,3-dioxygenase